MRQPCCCRHYLLLKVRSNAAARSPAYAVSSAGGYLGGRESRERSPGLWVIVAGVVILNLWYDYYHPLGIIFDVIIGTIILVAYAKKS